LLHEAIQAYAEEVAGTAMVYDSHSYPYSFIDTDANGEVDAGEAAFPSKYNAWTGRLTKAAYNYQVSVKDSGALGAVQIWGKPPCHGLEIPGQK